MPCWGCSWSIGNDIILALGLKDNEIILILYYYVVTSCIYASLGLAGMQCHPWVLQHAHLSSCLLQELCKKS